MARAAAGTAGRTLVAVMIAVAAAGERPAAPPASTGAAGGYRVVVASDRSGALLGYSIRPDGSGLAPLLAHSKPLEGVAVSRDGSTVAYVPRPNQYHPTISISRANGTGLHTLRLPGLPDAITALSRDGRLLAFETLGPDSLWVVGADGRGLRRIASTRLFLEADWAPDAKAVAFVGTLTAHDLHNSVSSLVVQPLRGKPRVLAHGRLGTLAWSPDGKWIAYDRVEGLYVVRPDGTGRRRILAGTIVTYAWSPDGKRLAVTGNGDVTLIDPVGRVLERLRLRGPESILFSSLSWSPDGRYLAFEDHRYRDDREDVWVVGSDGYGLRHLMRGRRNFVAGWA